MATPKNLRVQNTSTRRIILGGRKGEPMVTLGGKADEKNGKPIDGAPLRARTLEGERATRFRKNRSMAELGEKLGLRYA